MRKHLTHWSRIGLLCATLGGAAAGQDRSAPEAAIVEPSLTTSTSSFAIQLRERLKDPEQRKVLRDINRKSIEQEHAPLDQVLMLDANTRSKLLELLTDLRIESIDRNANQPPGVRTSRSYPSMEALQAAVERERFTDNERQRTASQASRDKQRIRALLGEARFQQYIDYESTVFQRHQVTAFNEQLPADAKLDILQREGLIQLLYGQRQQEDEARQLFSARSNGESARRGYGATTSVDPNLQELWFREQRLQQVEADSTQLLARLPDVLTPRQFAVYAANEAKNVAQELQLAKRMRKRAGVDVEKTPVLPPDPTAAVSPRTPLAGRVRLEVSIKVNESAITQRSVTADNGGVVSFEVEQLTIEAAPILFEDGWRELTLKFYESDGKGGRRRIISNSWGAGIMAGADPVQKLDALALWASRGYAIVGNFTLSAANP